MSALSILNEVGIAVGCANPIYLTSELDQGPGARITFEVLEADASYLKRLVGKIETFGIESSRGLFLAELTSLEAGEPRFRLCRYWRNQSCAQF